MTRKHAYALAYALNGKVMDDSDDINRAVGLTVQTPEGPRFARIELGAGARYFDEHAHSPGYATHGSDPRGEVHAEEWIRWDGGRDWAVGLASILGPSAEIDHSGGGIWLVYFTRADGKCVCIGEESAGIYRNRDVAYDAWDGNNEQAINNVEFI